MGHPNPLRQPPAMTRNAIAPVPGLGTDHGPDTEGRTVPHLSEKDIALRSAVMFHHLMQELKDQAFDYTHPVDEWGPAGGQLGSAVIIPQVTLQPDYDMPERITNVTAVIPVGCTLAQIQLGQRILTAYSGGALASPFIFQLTETGIIINSDDQRILNLTGTITTAPYLGLTGFALTRGQFS